MAPLPPLSTCFCPSTASQPPMARSTDASESWRSVGSFNVSSSRAVASDVGRQSTSLSAPRSSLSAMRRRQSSTVLPVPTPRIIPIDGRRVSASGREHSCAAQTTVAHEPVDGLRRRRLSRRVRGGRARRRRRPRRRGGRVDRRASHRARRELVQGRVRRLGAALQHGPRRHGDGARERVGQRRARRDAVRERAEERVARAGRVRDGRGLEARGHGHPHGLAGAHEAAAPRAQGEHDVLRALGQNRPGRDDAFLVRARLQTRQDGRLRLVGAHDVAQCEERVGQRLRRRRRRVEDRQGARLAPALQRAHRRGQRHLELREHDFGARDGRVRFVDVRRRELAVGAGDDDDLVLAGAVDDDVRDAGRGGLRLTDVRCVDAEGREVAQRRRAERVRADLGDHGHAAPQKRRGDGLVRALAAEELLEARAQQSLAGPREARRAGHEVDVGAADDDDGHG